MAAQNIARNALQAVLNVGRGSTGRLILEAHEEQAVRKALDAINSLESDMKAAFEAKYQRDWNDPAGDEIKAVWAAAWAVAKLST